jgi:hypothetical protein
LLVFFVSVARLPQFLIVHRNFPRISAKPPNWWNPEKPLKTFFKGFEKTKIGHLIYKNMNVSTHNLLKFLEFDIF